VQGFFNFESSREQYRATVRRSRQLRSLSTDLSEVSNGSTPSGGDELGAMHTLEHAVVKDELTLGG
jgi:hypothetical protein